MAEKSKEMCVGCRDDFYNDKNPLGITECWMYEGAKVVRRFRIGWWTPPTSPEAFTEVETLSCHNAPGKYAQHDQLPERLVNLTRRPGSTGGAG